jgi:hypothetical protein
MVYPGSPLLLTHSIKVGEHGLDVRCAASVLPHPTSRTGSGES